MNFIIIGRQYYHYRINCETLTYCNYCFDITDNTVIFCCLHTLFYIRTGLDSVGCILLDDRKREGDTLVESGHKMWLVERPRYR